MTEDLRKRLGQKAKELRKKAGLTQEEVAELIGVYRTDLSAFESRGEKIGSLESVNKLFESLGAELTVIEKDASEKKTKLTLRLPASTQALSPA